MGEACEHNPFPFKSKSLSSSHTQAAAGERCASLMSPFLYTQHQQELDMKRAGYYSPRKQRSGKKIRYAIECASQGQRLMNLNLHLMCGLDTRINVTGSL